MRRLLFGVLHPLDVHVFTPAEFEDSAYEPLSFAWVIARQARLYHWTEEARQRVPSLETLRRSKLPARRTLRVSEGVENLTG